MTVVWASRHEDLVSDGVISLPVCAHRGVVVRKNSLRMPLDDIPSTCDNKYEGIPLPVVEGPIGYDTMPTLAPHAGSDHRHALDAAGR